MNLNYTNSGGADAGVLKKVESNIAFGHINLKKATIHYKNEDGKSLQASQTKLGFLGEKINFSAPNIEGYNLKMPQLVDRELTFSNSEQNVEYVYEKIVPEVTLEQSVDKAKAQPGEKLHYKIDVGSVQEAAKDLGSSIISIEYFNDQGQKISTDSIHDWKKGTSYDFSEIPAIEGFDNSGVTVSSNATGTVADDDIVIKLSGFKATMDNLVQKKVRYVDENNQSISVDEIYLGRDNYLPNYSVKAKLIPGYALSDGIESYPVIFNATSPVEYIFRYHSTRNYRSLNIMELLDTNLENPTNFTWKTKDNVEISNASVTYDQISRKITATPPAEGIAYNHESIIEFDATIVSTPVGNLISQTVNLKADYLVDGTMDISTDPPTKTQIVTESQVIVTFIDDGTPSTKIAKDIIFTQEIGNKINLAEEKTVQDTIETLKKKYVLLEPLPSEIIEVTDEVQTIAYKFSGRLFIESFPSSLTFGDKYLSKSFIKEEQPKYDAPLIIGDNRHKKTPWTLTATLEKPLTSEESPSEVLPRALWYKTSKGSKVMLYEGEAQPIETGTASPLGEYNISKNWDANATGLQLNIYSNEIIQKGDYKATILWQVSATP
nr:MucBP domain-containing protein [Enterococcus sp. DIV0869a]